MRIKKISQAVSQDYSVNGSYNTSQSQAYSCDYFNNNRSNYSTTEEIVGTYNNKPVYKKVITGTATATKPSGSIFYKFDEVMLSDVNILFKANGYITTGTVDFQINSTDFDDSNGSIKMFTRVIKLSNGNVRVDYRNISGTYTSIPYLIILEYTKTTD